MLCHHGTHWPSGPHACYHLQHVQRQHNGSCTATGLDIQRMDRRVRVVDKEAHLLLYYTSSAVARPG
jgi:hypothetical protein